MCVNPNPYDLNNKTCRKENKRRAGGDESTSSAGAEDDSRGLWVRPHPQFRERSPVAAADKASFSADTSLSSPTICCCSRVTATIRCRPAGALQATVTGTEQSHLHPVAGMGAARP